MNEELTDSSYLTLLKPKMMTTCLTNIFKTLVCQHAHMEHIIFENNFHNSRKRISKLLNLFTQVHATGNLQVFGFYYFVK